VLPTSAARPASTSPPNSTSRASRQVRRADHRRAGGRDRAGEDRIAFKDTMNRLDVPMPRSDPAFSVEEAEKIAKDLAIRSSSVRLYLGGTAEVLPECRGVAHYRRPGHLFSLVGQVLIEESVLGWRNSNSRSCATPTTRRSRYASSRTWTQWAYTR